jgi:hypothetical protein
LGGSFLAIVVRGMGGNGDEGCRQQGSGYMSILRIRDAPGKPG